MKKDHLIPVIFVVIITIIMTLDSPEVGIKLWDKPQIVEFGDKIDMCGKTHK